MVTVLQLAAVVGAVCVVFGIRTLQVGARLRRLEKRANHPAGQRLRELEETAAQLNAELDELRPQRRTRRRSFGVIEGGGGIVAVPFALVLTLAVAAAAVALLGEQDQEYGARVTPTTVPAPMVQSPRPAPSYVSPQRVEPVIPSTEASLAPRRASSPPERGREEEDGPVAGPPPAAGPSPQPPVVIEVPDTPEVTVPPTVLGQEPVDPAPLEVDVLDLGLRLDV